jgi:hypothetical protein
LMLMQRNSLLLLLIHDVYSCFWIRVSIMFCGSLSILFLGYHVERVHWVNHWLSVVLLCSVQLFKESGTVDDDSDRTPEIMFPCFLIFL